MIKPSGHRVLVKKDPIEKETKGGIVLAVDEKLERTGVQTGILVANGPQAWKAFRELDENGQEHNGRPWAIPGDYIVFARFAGKHINDPFDPEEKNYSIMNDEDIIAVIVEGTYEIKENPHRKQVIQEEA